MKTFSPGAAIPPRRAGSNTPCHCRLPRTKGAVVVFVNGFAVTPNRDPCSPRRAELVLLFPFDTVPVHVGVVEMTIIPPAASETETRIRKPAQIRLPNWIINRPLDP